MTCQQPKGHLFWKAYVSDSQIACHLQNLKRCPMCEETSDQNSSKNAIRQEHQTKLNMDVGPYIVLNGYPGVGNIISSFSFTVTGSSYRAWEYVAWNSCANRSVRALIPAWVESLAEPFTHRARGCAP